MQGKIISNNIEIKQSNYRYLNYYDKYSNDLNRTIKMSLNSMINFGKQICVNGYVIPL